MANSSKSQHFSTFVIKAHPPFKDRISLRAHDRKYRPILVQRARHDLGHRPSPSEAYLRRARAVAAPASRSMRGGLGLGAYTDDGLALGDNRLGHA